MTPRHLSNHHYVMVPGWNGSGDDHWQSHWQRRLPNSSRSEVASWSQPELDDWVGALERAIAAARRPVVLVAHSLGCITVAHWAARRASDDWVKGALLVAPADVERWNANPALSGFAPIPKRPLPFPTLMVGSTDDPTASLERIQYFANVWHSACHVIRGAEHINAASGHTRWEDGFELLGCLGLRPRSPGCARPERRSA